SGREKEMEGIYPLGVITASILAFLLLVGIHGRWGKGRKAAGKRGSVAVAAGFGGADVIVVGAGVTGSALAYTLGKSGFMSLIVQDGRRVHVIERDLVEPDRIVGEILQPGGCLNLFELGLEGKAFSPFLSSVQLKQGTVTSLIKEDGIVKGVVYKTKSGKESKAFAPLTIVCDGCFSNLRRTLCSSEVKINRELEVSFLFHFSSNNCIYSLLQFAKKFTRSISF
ncbi:hypothetical protein GW17_00053595, partial [Ensete ventricosum]